MTITPPHGPGRLDWAPATTRPELLADPVRQALSGLAFAGELRVAPIDPELADTAAFCERYGVKMAQSANCVVVAGKRGGEVSYAACLVLATTRLDVNGAVRARLGARKASFAPLDAAVELTGMEYGGITPVGVPGWPIFVDARIAGAGMVVIGSGLRRSKITIGGALLGRLPGAEVIEDLAHPVPASA